MGLVDSFSIILPSRSAVTAQSHLPEQNQAGIVTAKKNKLGWELMVHPVYAVFNLDRSLQKGPYNLNEWMKRSAIGSLMTMTGSIERYHGNCLLGIVGKLFGISSVTWEMSVNLSWECASLAMTTVLQYTQ